MEIEIGRHYIVVIMEWISWPIAALWLHDIGYDPFCGLVTPQTNIELVNIGSGND